MADPAPDRDAPTPGGATVGAQRTTPSTRAATGAVGAPGAEAPLGQHGPGEEEAPSGPAAEPGSGSPTGGMLDADAGASEHDRGRRGGRGDEREVVHAAEGEGGLGLAGDDEPAPVERPAGGPTPLTVPRPLRTASELVVRAAVLAAAALVVGWLVLYLRVVTVPAFAALLLASVVHPVVDRLRRRGWSDMAATWSVLLVAIVVIGGGLALLVPAVADQTDDFGTQFDEGLDEIETWLVEGPIGLDQPPDLQGAIQAGVDRVREADPGQLTSGLTAAAEAISGFFLGLLFFFFFVKDGPKMVAWFDRQVPRARRPSVRRGAAAAWRTLSHYMGGVAVIGAFNGTVIGIGLALLGVPLAVPLGIITALSAFFPLVGAVVAGALAAVIALVAGGAVKALVVIGLTVAVQQFEGNVLEPVVMGRAVRLHPVVVLAVVAAGAVVAGILGAFLAVPVVAVASAVTRAVRRGEGDQADGDSAAVPTPS